MAEKRKWWVVSSGIVLELEGIQTDPSDPDMWYFEFFSDFKHVDELYSDKKVAVLDAIEECYKQIQHYAGQLKSYAAMGLSGGFDT